jgi:Family of unknown function (DUF6152)
VLSTACIANLARRTGESETRPCETNFQFIPHVQIFLDEKNEKGEIEKWICEARGPSMLVRIGGWDKGTLKAGDVITAIGH